MLGSQEKMLMSGFVSITVDTTSLLQKANLLCWRIMKRDIVNHVQWSVRHF